MSLNRTNIDWPGLGYSWNPIVGCANGCTYCYARKFSNRLKMIPDFSKPVFFPERIDKPIKRKKPATIFVGSMCDIFSDGVKSTWIHHIIETVRYAPQHTFMFLTKNPAKYSEFNWPPNCILGTTITQKIEYQRYVLIANRIYNEIFVSIEPILGDFKGWYFDECKFIIVGADSTPGAVIPPLDWVKSIKHENIWYKQNLRKHYPKLNNDNFKFTH